jgi:hypothetical protein
MPDLNFMAILLLLKHFNKYLNYGKKDTCSRR